MLTLVFAAVTVIPLLAQAPRGSRSPSQLDLPALLHAAEQALERKDFPTAVTTLKSVLARQPDFAPGWFDLGFAYSNLRQNDEAASAYQKAITLQPNLFQARLNFGILLLEAQKPQEAREQLAKAVELKPGLARAHLYYGRALALANQPAEAEKEFRQAIALDPKLPGVAYDLGQLALQEKRYEDALASFQQAAELDASLAQAELGTALALEGLKRAAEAAPHFEKYLAMKPDDLETRFHLARVDLDLGANDQALEQLETVYHSKPAMTGLAAALGDVNALLKKFPESEKFYRQALADTPNQPDLHRALGQTLLDEQRFPGAEAEFRAALKLDPHSADAAKGLASSLYLQKRYAEAIPLYEALLKAPHPPVGLFFVLATCYDDLKVRPKALENYQRYLELAHGENPDQEWQARQRAKLLSRVLGK